MALTWLDVRPLVITKASVTPSSSPIARMTVSSPDFASAARAATMLSSGTAGSSCSTTGTVLVDVKGRLLLALLRRGFRAVSYTHLRAHETVLDLVCRLLL